MTTDTGSADKAAQTFILGCAPQIRVNVVEVPDGTLFFDLAPVTFDGSEPDIDGFFLNLSDDSTVGSIVFFPVLNDRSVTGQQAEANGVDTLSNGAMVESPFDLGLQFGTADDSTEGTIGTINFTLRSEDGPLRLSDFDLESMAAIVNSDGPDGMVLTTDDGPDAPEPVEVTTVLQEEDFDHLRDPDDSDEILRDGRWDVRDDALRTDGRNDGMLKFAQIETDDPVTLSFDIRAENLDRFENAGRFADSLKLQVRIDEGSWQTLDTFAVNDDNTAMVGSNTGATFDETGGTLSYSGGVLDDAGDSVQFRLYSDITASNERIHIDNWQVTSTETIVGSDADAVKIDFEDLERGETVWDQYDGVTISAQRDGDEEGSANDAMTFDTDAPTGRDWDLEYDGVGNALIISEDNDENDPDDNWQGGTIGFAFEEPSNVMSLKFLDIEESGGTVDLFNIEGELIRTLDIPVNGNNGEGVLDIDTDGVSAMDVNLVGSGAVDDLCYVPSTPKECDAQYPVDYDTGLPMLPVDEEEETATEEEPEAEPIA